MKFTAVIVRDLVKSRVESDEPDAVLKVFQQDAGKPFTKRILAKLPGGEARWSIHQIASMTSIQDRTYRDGRGERGFSFLVAYQLKNITIDPAVLVKQNTGYFEARERRNAERQELIKDEQLCGKMAEAMTAYNEAKAKLEEAMAALESLTEHGAPFAADRYEIEKLCGAREVKP